MALTRGSPESRRALGARLRSARKAANLTLKELAARVGVRPGTVVSWESGQRQPSVEQLAAFAQACGADVAWLVTGRSPETALAEQLRKLAAEVSSLSAALDRWAAERPPAYWGSPTELDSVVDEAVEEAFRQLRSVRNAPESELRAALSQALRKRLGGRV
ncbi:MAG: helix-turn-helix domain-containing protein [Armatimonadota bacterium]|nr:helix-turn-helix domain-containing protein [Armatimonadota bacterium]MDR7393232.1 helix-turn-helix domain-containing protein [Armatimonadota bacterium]MDR7397855.1 helix-turn-helix domain-containing protein [Armatimonadota bacterium]MDR7405334.1 helix-turn-helix domain-containing protein [Armatimonadota bacterium]MDR7408300.1 helix-turn-helix domain-containing protein [Armatimonadota bacterium]